MGARGRPVSEHQDVVVTRSILLEHVAPEDVRVLIARAVPRSFGRGQVAFQRGDPADGLYLIVSGEFRVVLESEEGKQVTLALLGRGDVLGDLPLLDGLPRSATAIAATPAQSLFVSAGDFESWLGQHPGALRSIATGLARRVRVNTEQIADMSLFDVESRVWRYVWQAFVRAAGGREPGPGQRVQLNQSEAASSIGTSRESVNKELRRLREEGIIGVEGRLSCCWSRPICGGACQPSSRLRVV